MATESIAHEASWAIDDSDPIQARGIIVNHTVVYFDDVKTFALTKG